MSECGGRKKKLMFGQIFVISLGWELFSTSLYLWDPDFCQQHNDRVSLIYCSPPQRNAYMQNWQFSSIRSLPYIKNLFVFVLNEWITTSTQDIVTKNCKKASLSTYLFPQRISSENIFKQRVTFTCKRLHHFLCMWP